METKPPHYLYCCRSRGMALSCQYSLMCVCLDSDSQACSFVFLASACDRLEGIRLDCTCFLQPRVCDYHSRAMTQLYGGAYCHKEKGDRHLQSYAPPSSAGASTPFCRIYSEARSEVSRLVPAWEQRSR